MNQVILHGIIGVVPELREVSDTFSVCSFTMATKDGRYDKDKKWIETTDWHKVDILGAKAENFVKVCSKGDTVLVVGRLKTDTWEDKKDGTKKSFTKVLCDKWTLSRKKFTEEKKREQTEIDDDDLF